MIQKIASASQSSAAYGLRSAVTGSLSSNVCAISSAVICRCISAVDMRFPQTLKTVSAPSPCGREGRSSSALFDGLNAIPIRLAVIEAFEADRLHHVVAELVPVHLGDGEALLLEES